MKSRFRDESLENQVTNFGWQAPSDGWLWQGDCHRTGFLDAGVCSGRGIIPGGSCHRTGFSKAGVCSSRGIFVSGRRARHVDCEVLDVRPRGQLIDKLNQGRRVRDPQGGDDCVRRGERESNISKYPERYPSLLMNRTRMMHGRSRRDANDNASKSVCDSDALRWRRKRMQRCQRRSLDILRGKDRQPPTVKSSALSIESVNLRWCNGRNTRTVSAPVIILA